MIIDPDRATQQKVPWPVKTFDNIGDNYGEGPQIKVRCIDPRGVYYNFLRRRLGDVFNLIPQYVTVIDPKTEKPLMENGQVKKRLVTAEEQFSPQTMEKVDQAEPETITTAGEAIRKAQEDLDGVRTPSKRR